MPPVISVATADMGLFKAVQFQMPEAYEGVFGARPVCEILATTASETKKAWFASPRSLNEQRLLVIDARLPAGGDATSDAEGMAAFDVLQGIRRDDRTPALVLTPRTNSMPEIEAYCEPGEVAIAMPLLCLDRPEMVMAFLGMLQQPPRKTWDTIEVEVRKDGATLYLGTNGRLSKWGDAASREYYPVPDLAYTYEDYKVLVYQRGGLLTVAPHWLREWRHVGQQLFRDLILRSLGTGLFYHIERAAGGLNGLAFRFRVKDPKLHNAPFEATVRISDHSDAEDSRFVLVHAPVARWMGTQILRTRREAVAAETVSRPARMLFIRSQVGDDDAPSIPDTLPVLGPPGPDGLRQVRNYAFRRLKNIDLEHKFLASLPQGKLEKLEPLDLEGDECRKDPSKAIRDALSVSEDAPIKPKYDIIHFAGHSLTADGQTLLVLPGATSGEAYAMPVEQFAEYVAPTSARLVYLSSCQGGSAQSVVHLAQRGVPHVIGFRWDVQDRDAADFAVQFYTELMGKDKWATISAAFQSTCNAVYTKLQRKDETPIWASPILIAQADNWVVQGILGPGASVA